MALPTKGGYRSARTAKKTGAISECFEKQERSGSVSKNRRGQWVFHDENTILSWLNIHSCAVANFMNLNLFEKVEMSGNYVNFPILSICISLWRWRRRWAAALFSISDFLRTGIRPGRSSGPKPV